MPETSGVYHAAYIAAAGIYIAYTVSLWTRARRVRERLDEARREARRVAAPPMSREVDRSWPSPHPPG